MGTKSILITVLFCGIIALGGLAAAIMPDAEVSNAERRRLAQVPEFTAEAVLSGEYFVQLDNSLTDQFVPREPLRTLKAASELYVFRRLDLHGLYLADGSVVALEYPLRETQVEGFIRKLNAVREKLLGNGNRMFYAVIPDKNYYYAESSGRLSMDYAKMLEMLAEGLEGMEYIDLFEVLSGEDYYKTDSHWRQERLSGVTAALAEGMGLTVNPFPESGEIKSFEPFYGVYSGQLALPVGQDRLIYLETSDTLSAEVTHIESGKSGMVYDEARLHGADPFDVYLSGATAVCTVTNNQNPGGRELIIFRDSFGSSIAPLLLPAYGRITLIDIRYISPEFLGEYAEFAGRDVLFLYGAGMINNSAAMR